MSNAQLAGGFVRLWPLPALLAWLGAWALFWGLRQIELPVVIAVALAVVSGVACSALMPSWWRRLITGLGFPLSLALLWGLATQWALPGWVWLMPLGALLLIYPLGAWRDAPLFPTPQGALAGLAQFAPLVDSAKDPKGIGAATGVLVLDAGCGLGQGLQALRREYPDASLHGIEKSLLLRFACALRCPWARVRRGDIWLADWRHYRMVYLFQRPESMPRAMAKARAEMAPGAWLVSLEFEVIGERAAAQLHSVEGKPVFIYRMA